MAPTRCRSKSFGIAVGVSAGGAGGVSVNVTGAGVIAFNQIVNAIEASIVNSTADAADDVIVAAEDGAAILSQLLAITVAAGGAGAVSVNVAVSATYAENTMGGSMLATIDGSNVESTGGAVTVEAYADNSITALGQAVGVAAGGAGGVSINVALSAVAATNISGNTVEASIKNGSDVDANDAADGAVTVSATDVSGILAVLVSVSAAAGGAGAVSVNVAGALVYASNAMSSSVDFDWNNDGAIDFYDIHAGVAVLTRLNELRAGVDGIFDDMAEAGADDTYDTPDDTSTADDNLTADQAIDALGGLEVFASGQPDAAYKAALKAKIGSTFDINGDGNVDYRDLLLTGTTSDDVRVGNALLATIADSQVDTAGAVTVSASTHDDGTGDRMEIESFGIAVGIAAGGAGGVSVNVAGAGVIAFNQVNNAIEASIVGSRDVTAGEDVTVEATNKAHILSVLGAVSVAAGGAGAVSVNVAVSVTYADNTLGGSVLATIDDSKVESTGGDVTVDADAETTLEAFGQSVGVAVGGAGGVSINVAVSAVIARNTLTNDVEASIVKDSDVDGESIAILATDSSTVDSTPDGGFGRRRRRGGRVIELDGGALDCRGELRHEHPGDHLRLSGDGRHRRRRADGTLRRIGRLARRGGRRLVRRRRRGLRLGRGRGLDRVTDLHQPGRGAHRRRFGRGRHGRLGVACRHGPDGVHQRGVRRRGGRKLRRRHIHRPGGLVCRGRRARWTARCARASATAMWTPGRMCG